LNASGSRTDALSGVFVYTVLLLKDARVGVVMLDRSGNFAIIGGETGLKYSVGSASWITGLGSDVA
jgi:hypothetical protein